MTLEDVQARPDSRGVALNEVGIRGLRYPVAVPDRASGKQETVGEFDLAVALDAHTKGAHMSRFVEVLRDTAAELSPESLLVILATLRERLDAKWARISVRFPFFRERTAPVSGARALMDYACTWAAEGTADDSTVSLTTSVPVTSVCPCSKAISDYGAHNQRGTITIAVDVRTSTDIGVGPIGIEDLVDLAERSASAPVLPLVKRPDERLLTMQAFDNPVFVEDMVRAVAVELHVDPRVAAFSVEAGNDESIHNHAAYARVSSNHR